MNGWSTVGKIAVGLVVANVVIGTVGGIGAMIYVAALRRRAERDMDLQQEAASRLIQSGATTPEDLAAAGVTFVG
ncbi:MAG: hypothetical protein PHC52_00520 [Syntrophales bacterium]|nr:hypothetical protein [Syntrophales bacterium]